MFSRIRLPLRGLVALAVMCLVLVANPASAQTWDTDTLRIISMPISPGDTAMLDIYLANSVQLGGYTVRLEYDTSMIDFVSTENNDSTIVSEQLRGDFLAFSFGRPEPGVITGVGAFVSVDGLMPGGGKTARLLMYAKDYAPMDATTQLAFAPDPYFPQSFNWFSFLSGLYIYQPLQFDGAVTITCDCTNNGDFNGDGGINPQDILLLSDFVYKSWGTAERITTACPVYNGDWKISDNKAPRIAPGRFLFAGEEFL